MATKTEVVLEESKKKDEESVRTNKGQKGPKKTFNIQLQNVALILTPINQRKQKGKLGGHWEAGNPRLFNLNENVI